MSGAFYAQQTRRSEDDRQSAPIATYIKEAKDGSAR